MRLPLISRDSSSPHADAGDESTSRIQRAQQLQDVGTTTIEAVAFWSAVILPVPILLSLASGVGTVSEFVSVAGLLVVNLMALYVGHDYTTAERH